MTDTNTPRDGLTDIDNALESGEALCDRVARTNALLAKEVRSAFQLLASIARRAADREARPAPASVEALTKWRQLLLGYGWSETDSTPGICLKVADEIRSALAASTPPAEAQPTFDALRALTEALLTRADDDYLRRQIDAAVKIMAGHRCEPPVPWPDPAWGIARWGAASEARATGEVAGEQAAFEAWCPYKGSPDPRVVWAAAWKAALSDRSTGAAREAAGWIDTGPCVLCSGSGRCYTPSDLAPAAPPVAQAGEPMKWKAKEGACLRRFVTDTTYRRFSSNIQRFYEPICEVCAATGAAGEPQPRENYFRDGRLMTKQEAATGIAPRKKDGEPQP